MHVIICFLYVSVLLCILLRIQSTKIFHRNKLCLSHPQEAEVENTQWLFDILKAFFEIEKQKSGKQTIDAVFGAKLKETISMPSVINNLEVSAMFDGKLPEVTFCGTSYFDTTLTTNLILTWNTATSAAIKGTLAIHENFSVPFSFTVSNLQCSCVLQVHAKKLNYDSKASLRISLLHMPTFLFGVESSVSSIPVTNSWLLHLALKYGLLYKARSIVKPFGKEVEVPLTDITKLFITHS